MLTWLGLDVYRRFRLRRILGVSTYRRALGANAAQLHLQAHPIVLLVLTGMALAGLARVLPGDGVGHEARQVLAALKSTLPVLDDARLDALAHPPSTTFIENQAVFIAEIDAVERTAGAGAGNAKALALLGRAYIYGIGVPVDLAEADRLITRAESLDSSTATAARAFYNVQKAHPKNTRMTGVATLKQLAAAGDIDANLYLGLMLDSQQEPVFTRNQRRQSATSTWPLPPAAQSLQNSWQPCSRGSTPRSDGRRGSTARIPPLSASSRTLFQQNFFHRTFTRVCAFAHKFRAPCTPVVANSTKSNTQDQK